MKTISELENKTGYRLLKVIYCIITLVIVSTIIYWNCIEKYAAQNDGKISSILCENGKTYNFADKNNKIISLGREKIQEQGLDDSDYSDEELLSMFKEKKGNDFYIKYIKGEIALEEENKINDYTYNNSTDNDSTFRILCGGKNNGEQNYKLVFNTETGRDWMGTIGGSLRIIIITLIITEILRRIIYYVKLGSFIPKKK